MVNGYSQTLEQQIVERGSSLVCRDEELFTRVEELLRDGDAQETHCLGLDPLLVMEESLKASATDTGRAKAKGGLQGLAKAFEVVEQAALNLYLGPWRKEYKFVKMYSGTFTHFIKPVLSTSQIEKLFGLLGYQLSSRHEQLRLQPSRVSPGSLGDLLRLACAFFLARCECRLLLMALGKHVGETQWELSVVRERQKGNSLQVTLDNTKKKLDVGQPLFEGEEEVDLYTDEQINGGQRARKEESARSKRPSQSGAPPSALKTLSNGVTSSSSSSASVPAREDIHVSTLNCQLAKMPPLEQDVPSSVCGQEGKLPCEESTFTKDDLQSRSQLAEGAGLFEAAAGADVCSCVQSPDIALKRCLVCNALHSVSSGSLKECVVQRHCTVSPDLTNATIEEMMPIFSQGGSREDASPPLAGCGTAASPLVICDDSSQLPKPFPFHHCCDLAQLDPKVLCLTCGVFHSGSCSEKDVCQKKHTFKPLGVCSCGSTCTRNPLVLCRYCGSEYCLQCWFRNPVTCSCGQTFDQTPV